MCGGLLARVEAARLGGEASPGGIQQDRAEMSDYGQEATESLKRESHKIQLQFDNSLTLE